MSAKVYGAKVYGAKVYGWCRFVEKSSYVVCQLMVLNKLWIPDVLIDIIKDHLYIGRDEVLRKYYRLAINRSITEMYTSNQTFMDVYGRDRLVVWQTGHIYGGGKLRLHGSVCVTCGDCSQLHHNINGCCTLRWDMADEPIQLQQQAVLEEEEEQDVIPETNIPVALVEDVRGEFWENDQEAEMADYAEYMEEVRMDAYMGRRVGR